MFNTNLFLTEADKLYHQNYTFVPGNNTIEKANYSNKEIADFISYWDDLKVDNYMNDGGNYRFRRYSAFTIDVEKFKLTLQPHSYYIQSVYVNNLNGDIKRYFEPLDTSFIKNNIFLDIIYSLATLYSKIKKDTSIWDIKVHPYRIYADKNTAGNPTPEGLHRDGVDFVSSMLINRKNIRGGLSTITDTNRKKLFDIQMEDTLDIVIENDENTLHQVSPVSPINEKTGYRDVLVIAFTSEQNL